MRKYEEDRVDLIVRSVVGAICFCLLAIVIVLLPRVMNSGKKSEAMTTTTTQEESSEEPTEKPSLPAVSLETISSETKVVVSVKQPSEPIPTPTTAPTPVPTTPIPVIVPETTPAPIWPDHEQAQPAIDPATRPEDLTPPKPVPEQRVPEPKPTVSDGRF